MIQYNIMAKNSFVAQCNFKFRTVIWGALLSATPKGLCFSPKTPLVFHTKVPTYWCSPYGTIPGYKAAI